MPSPGTATVTLGQTLLWVGILLGCFLAGSAAVYLVRRYARAQDEPSREPSLTLGQVRQMRQRGEITEEEYQRLKRVITLRLEGGGGAPERSGRSE